MQLRIEFTASSSKKTLEKVLEAVCAILNSSKEGGKLIVFSGACPYSQKDADDITRKIEQKLQATFGFGAANDIFTKIPPTTDEEIYEMCYQIKSTPLLPSGLCTINYNLFATSDSQVYQVPASEKFERIVEIIKGEQPREMKSVLGQHIKEFSLGEKVALEESRETQFKLLTDESSHELASRMTDKNNKLTHYVSGFANGSGGHIYHGIKLDKVTGSYVVYGQTVHDKDDIISHVEKTIKKLFTWPYETECLTKGHQWDIYFEEVSNTEQPKYIVVISVNSHEKGVFVREPESFHIVDEKPKRLDFDEWRKRFLMADYRNIFPHEMLQRNIERCKWSSPEAKEQHIDVLKNLILLRNNGNEQEFELYKEQLSHENSNAITKCLIQQQEAANFFRKRLLDKAERKLEENENLLMEISGKCCDVEIYRVRRLYWAGVVKRAEGDYEKCNALCEDALQLSHDQPNILVVPWIFYSKAKALEIDIAKQSDSTHERSLRETCMQHYESALRCSFALSEFPEKLVVDLQQRVLIGMARLSLGAFFDGDHVVHKTCLAADIKHADYLLQVLVDSVERQGWPMTTLSSAEYVLVRSERYYRSWKQYAKSNFIKLALDESKKALETADKKNFKDVSDFANGQIEILKEFDCSKSKIK